MKKDFDIIVIGSGSAGLNVAGFMNKAGFSTLLIEKDEANIGGDCLNTGCIPSKALIHAATLAHHAKEAERFGFGTSGKVDMEKVQEYIDSRREIIRKHEDKAHFESLGMTVKIGTATFVDRKTVAVENEHFTAPKIILATGSRPRELDIPGSEDINVLTNETIFEQKTLPEKFLVVGGGPIGMEIGQAYARLGSEVTILERGNQFLSKEDSEIADVLKKQLEKEGVEIIFNASAKRFEGVDTLIYEKDGTEETLTFDTVMASIGRITNVDKDMLEKGGVEVKDGKLVLDEHFRTTNKNVYALGDVAGGFQFTHAAEMHARVVISNLLSPFKKSMKKENIAWVTYTDPEIATFGRQEKELEEKNISYEVIKSTFEDEDRAIVDDSREGMLKLFISGKKILGGTMVGASAGELVQELILAQQAGISLDTLFSKTYPYPTKTRINKKAIGEHQSKKLTPRNKKILQWAYKIFS